MLKAYHLQLFYIKRSGPGAWNYLNIAKMSENVFFTFFLVVLGGWGKNTSKWALGCKNAYFLKMVAPMASIINMDLINIWKKSEKNFEQNRPESSLQVVTACVGAQCLATCNKVTPYAIKLHFFLSVDYFWNQKLLKSKTPFQRVSVARLLLEPVSFSHIKKTVFCCCLGLATDKLSLF